MNALAVCQGMLVVGGYFNQVGDGVVAHSIARWDGEHWFPLGSGIGTGGHCDYQYVFALAPLEKWIYAAGNFIVAGGQAVNRIARWDGNDWRRLEEGLDDYVFALTLHDHALIAGGKFAHAGGVPAAGIARWDGVEWTALGSGLDSRVDDLLPIGTDLYVGGEFTRAGNKPSYSIARWSRELADVTPHVPCSACQSLYIPNPYRPRDIISFTPAAAGRIEIGLWDVNGRLVRRLEPRNAEIRPYQISWDGRSDSGLRVATGIYYLRMASAGLDSRQRLVLIP